MTTTETMTLSELCTQLNALPDAASRQCALFYLRGLRDGAVIRGAGGAGSDSSSTKAPEDKTDDKTDDPSA